MMTATTPSASTPNQLIKLILSQKDLDQFVQSQCFLGIWEFLLRLNQQASLSGTRHHQPNHLNLNNNIITHQICNLIEKCESLLLAFPPESSSSENATSKPSTGRFGNLAFRSYYKQCKSMLYQWTCEWEWPVSTSSPLTTCLRLEALEYFANCFGNFYRIDYGTGHELNFLLFLYCLYLLGMLNGSAEDTRANGQLPLIDGLVFKVFKRYLVWMRRLQFTYWLEPAGSHGVWGLDDYQFLPFLFGSAQLICKFFLLSLTMLIPLAHKYLRPKSIHDDLLVDELADEYLYFNCIRFINSVKTSASLQWHSPLLNDISGVKTWRKVNQGLLKMYRHELFGKLPIMQHFLFGKLIGGVGWEKRFDLFKGDSLVFKQWSDCLETAAAAAAAIGGGDRAEDEKHAHNSSHEICIEEFIPDSSLAQQCQHYNLVGNAYAQLCSVLKRAESMGDDQSVADIDAMISLSIEDEQEFDDAYADADKNNTNEDQQKLKSSVQHTSKYEEVVVKYVRGAHGQQIPIMGRLASSHASLIQHQSGCRFSGGLGGKKIMPGADAGIDGEKSTSGVDNTTSKDDNTISHLPALPVSNTYAMGQQAPTCCGIRIPSAIAAKMYEQNRAALPFD